MQIKIGQIYKVKPEFREEYGVFSDLGGVYIRYINDIPTYEILDKSKNCISSCGYCFKPEHLEPVEKTLYNLEINDFVEDRSGYKRKILGLIESSPENPLYAVSYYAEFEIFLNIVSAKYLEGNGYKVVQTEPSEEIKEMTVEEVSKLVGKRVKIVE